MVKRLLLLLPLLLGQPAPSAWAGPAVAEFVVAIDVGHSPKKAGATSARGRREYAFNRTVAERLLQQLHAQGLGKAFILTASNPEMGLLARASLAGAKRADLLLSIHHDSVQPQYLTEWFHDGGKQYYSDRFSGFSLFYSGKNPHAEKSLLFARLLGEELVKDGFSPSLHHAEPIEGENRPLIDARTGVYQFDDLIVLKKTSVPAVLLECGIIVNRQEELRLNSASYQGTLARAVARAILGYAVSPSP